MGVRRRAKNPPHKRALHGLWVAASAPGFVTLAKARAPTDAVLWMECSNVMHPTGHRHGQKAAASQSRSCGRACWRRVPRSRPMKLTASCRSDQVPTLCVAVASALSHSLHGCRLHIRPPQGAPCLHHHCAPFLVPMHCKCVFVVCDLFSSLAQIVRKWILAAVSNAEFRNTVVGLSDRFLRAPVL